MADVVSFAEIEEQHVELIPGRTLMQTGPLYEDAEGVSYDNLYEDDLDDDLYLDEDFYLDDVHLDDGLAPAASATDPPPSSGTR